MFTIRGPENILSRTCILHSAGDANCANNNDECNGPLRSSTTYTFEACALNEDNLYVCTGPTAPYTTAAVGESNNTCFEYYFGFELVFISFDIVI